MVIHTVFYLRDSRHIHRAQVPIVCDTRSGIEWGWFRTKGYRQALHQNSIRMNIIWGTWQGASDRRWQIEDIWGLCHTLCLPRFSPSSEFGSSFISNSSNVKFRKILSSLFWCTVNVNYWRKRSQMETRRTCKISPLHYFLFSCEDHSWEESKLSFKSFCKYKITSELCCDLSSCQSKETTAVCFLLWLIYSGA